MTGADLQHPVFAFPVVTVVCSSCLRYYNMTFMDAIWWLVSCAGDIVMIGVYLIQKMTGGPTPNTLVAILLIYGLVLRGLSSACGMAFFIWKTTLWMVHMVVYYCFTIPVSVLRTWGPTSTMPLSPGTTFPPHHQSTLVPSSAPTRQLPDSDKTSGCDSNSAPSETSSGKEAARSVKKRILSTLSSDW